MTVSKRPDRVLGPGHDKFWEWCGKQQLRLPRCGRCGYVVWPIMQSCEKCGNEQLVWEQMSGQGRLVSWCTFERDYYAGTLAMPWDTILVELGEGPLFISNPVGFTWKDCKVGMPVQLRFIDCADQAGRFSLPVFAAA
jgi:uncharacterized protein